LVIKPEGILGVKINSFKRMEGHPKTGSRTLCLALAEILKWVPWISAPSCAEAPESRWEQNHDGTTTNKAILGLHRYYTILPLYFIISF
jgi:hypothetical protein